MTRDALRDRIRRDALIEDADAPKLSSRGNRLGWMFDFRRSLLDAEFLECLADIFWQRFGHLGAVQVGGVEFAAVPMVTALTMSGRARGVSVNGFVVRKERKTYGSQRLIEGDLNGNPVIFVDDLINSGSSLRKASAVLAALDCRISHVFTIVDFKSAALDRWKAETGIPVQSLFDLDEFGLHLRRASKPPQRGYAPRWRFAAPSPNPYHVVPKSAPLVFADRLYVGSDAGVFWCLDTRDGSVLWNYPAPSRSGKGIWSSPRQHDGHIYFGSYNGAVICLDAMTGAAKWINEACEWVGSTPVIMPDRKMLVIGLEYARPTVRGSMAAISLDTGKILWEQWLREPQHGSAAYWQEGGLVVAGTNDHAIVAFEASSGRTRWHFETERSIKYAPVIDAGRGLVAAASFDRSIYVLDLRTGSLRGKFETDGQCYTTPLLANGRLFCGSADKRLHVIDLDTMTVIARIEAGARVYASPVLLGDAVCFGTCGGLVREIDPVTLETLGEIQVADAVTNAVAQSADASTIFVPTYMNEIYAFERLASG